MFCFYYIHKGPRNTLMAYYTASAIITKTLDPLYETQVPPLCHCWDRRVTFKNPCRESKVLLYSIDKDVVNSDDYLAVHRLKNRIISRARGEGLAAEEVMYCKEVVNPKTWPERLAVIAAVMHRREYMDAALSYRGLDLDIEKDKDAQIEILKHHLLFDPLFKWDKCMQAFEHVYPKPAWYRKEFISYNNIVGE